eukprot:scaffold130622_cov54-Phaeocystis_antarctica.AAC.2
MGICIAMRASASAGSGSTWCTASPRTLPRESVLRQLRRAPGDGCTATPSLSKRLREVFGGTSVR